MLDNSLDYFSKQADKFLQDVWGDREMGMPVLAINWTKPPTRQMVAALLKRYPYVQIVSSQMQHRDEVIPEFVEAPSGWIIHDYDQAMSVSLGEFLFEPEGSATAQLFEEDEDEEGGEGTRRPRGSLIQQTFDTAEAMVERAIKKGWPGIQIVSGTEALAWSLWMAAEDRNYPLVGYEPSLDDKKKRLRILNYRTERGLGRGISPQPGNR